MKNVIIGCGLILLAVALYVTVSKPETQISENIQSDNKTAALLGEWRSYVSDEVGFSIEYPAAFEVTHTTSGVSEPATTFSYWGPTQEPNTEFYDGVSMTITRRTLPSSEVQSFAEAELDRIKPAVDRIDRYVHEVSIGKDLTGFAYTVTGVGTHTTVFLPLEHQAVLQISYSAPDPENAGYAAVVDRMRASFAVRAQDDE